MHGILIPVPMVYRLPMHGILTPLPISGLEMRGQNTIQGGSVFNKGFNIPWMRIDLGVNLPWGSKYHMTPGANPRRIGDRLV